MRWQQDLYGHQHIQRQLEQYVESSNIPHALLFTGPKDVGKYRMAREFAVLLNRKNPEYVRQIEKNIHSDTITMGDLWQADRLEDWGEIAKTSNFDQYHRTGKKDGDAARRTDAIGVKDIHAFLEPLSHQTIDGFKLGIIRDAERMTTEAANALLKNLEEPPPQTILVLTATHPRLVLQTILSRCRVIHFSLLPELNLKQYLQTLSLPTERVDEYLVLSQGRPECLRRLRDDSEFFEQERRRFQEISHLFIKPDALRFTQLAEQLATPDKNEELKLFIDHLGRFLRSVVIEKAQNKQLLAASTFSYDHLLAIYKQWSFTRNGLTANANRRLLLENMLFSIL
jgi:DNA polymerase-3 subunit delta'